MSVRVAYAPFHDARKWEREGTRTRDAQVCLQVARLLRGGKVLVLDRPTCLAEFARFRGRWSVRGTAISWSPCSRLSHWADGLLVADCLLPELGFQRGSFHLWLIRAYGSGWYAAHLRMIRERCEGSDDVLWICHPFAANLTGQWRANRIVFDAFDNFAIHPELPPRVHSAVARAYSALCQRADRIVVNSTALQEYVWRLGRHDALVVPNGADPVMFAGARPMRLEWLERPLVGYAGKLGLRIDVELLCTLARAMRRGTIVVAGQLLNRGWMRAALKHPRVSYLGDLHYSRLPSFLAACDVCVVPHRVGMGENAGDPTKIYEYLAAGKPVITTRIAGVERFKGRVAIAESAASFVEATVAALQGEGAPTGMIFPSETWEARTAVILDHFGLRR